MKYLGSLNKQFGRGETEAEYVLPISMIFWSASFVNQEHQKVNVLLIMSDNHSWNHASTYGDRVIKTPSIKRGFRQTLVLLV